MKNILLVLLASCSAAQATAQGYGMAGCGLGSIVTKELNWGNDHMQIFAATTNGTAGSQTFGITAGTSNCGTAASPGLRKGVEGERRAERQVYLRYNLAQVKADAARGEGEYIAGLADLFGCRGPFTGSYAGFAQLSQSQHAKIFTSDQPEVVNANFEQLMAQDGFSCS